MTAAALAVLVVATFALAVIARRRRYALAATVAAAAAVAAGVVGVADAAALALWLGALAVAGALAGVAAVAVRRTLEADRRRPLPASGGLIGQVGVVRRTLDPIGQIAVRGELWTARRSWIEDEDPPPNPGERVIVEDIQGLTLTVRRAENWEVDQ